MKQQPQKISRLPHWHRYLGLTGAIFTLLLAITGILLNHTTDLGLDKQRLNSGWLMALYGQEAPTPVSYQVGPSWLTQLGRRLYLNDQEIADDTAPMAGAVEFSGMLVIATHDALWLFSNSGELLERLGKDGNLPGTPLNIGTANNQLALKTDRGWHHTSEALFPWTSASQIPTIIASTSEAPTHLLTRLSKLHQGEGLTLERLLLDLHTGRTFGLIGVYFNDLIGLILSGLALTGISVWMRRRRKMTKFG